jgi:hypothetical protein
MTFRGPPLPRTSCGVEASKRPCRAPAGSTPGRDRLGCQIIDPSSRPMTAPRAGCHLQRCWNHRLGTERRWCGPTTLQVAPSGSTPGTGRVEGAKEPRIGRWRPRESPWLCRGIGHSRGPYSHSTDGLPPALTPSLPHSLTPSYSTASSGARSPDRIDAPRAAT